LKILIFCSALDLKYKKGCTPHWWQLFKGMYENGNEVIVIPFLGDPIESLWWRTYPNPCALESKLYFNYLERERNRKKERKINYKNTRFLIKLTNKYIKNKLEKYLIEVLKKEGDIGAVLFMNVPLNYLSGIALKIRNEFSIPVGYFDADMPTALPEYIEDTHLIFDYYKDADLSEYDAFFTNSKGVIPDLREHGAKNIHTIYFAADAELYKPLKIEKDIDISFYGYGDNKREKWIENMITKPSKKLQDVNFTIGGSEFKTDLGNAKQIGPFPYSKFRDFCCRSNICLNITRKTMATVYASATARVFELAAFGSCTVSNPVSGIEEWFKVGEELFVVKDEQEVLDLYKWLLDSKEEREKIGKKARERILKEHTFYHRAEKIIRVLNS